MTKTLLVCLDGKFVPHEDAHIAISDGGFLFGETLFETLKAHGNNILLAQRHLERLETSAQLLDFPFDRHQIERSLDQLAAGLTAPTSRIRLTISRGAFTGLTWPSPQAAHFLLTAVPYTELTDAQRQAGAACVFAPNQRVNPLSHLAQMKRGNYADCLYAFNHARAAGAGEALFRDPDRYILEGSTTNVFAVIDDRLITAPPDNLVLDGIMRREVIKTAAELGIQTSERKLHTDELAEADEMFLTNSLIDILPLSSIDGLPIKRGDCWKSLLKTLWMRIET